MLQLFLARLLVEMEKQMQIIFHLQSQFTAAETLIPSGKTMSSFLIPAQGSFSQLVYITLHSSPFHHLSLFVFHSIYKLFILSEVIFFSRALVFIHFGFILYRSVCPANRLPFVCKTTVNNTIVCVFVLVALIPWVSLCTCVTSWMVDTDTL